MNFLCQKDLPTDLPPRESKGVVVPIAACLVPETAAATCEKAFDVICCLGETVSKVEPFEETST